MEAGALAKVRVSWFLLKAVMATWALRLIEAACPSLNPSSDKVLAVCLSLCPKCPSKKPVTVSGAGAFLQHGLVFLNDICSDLVPKQGHILKCWGLGLQCRNGGGGYGGDGGVCVSNPW